MSMGVPREEYWHGDYTQLSEYRKSFEIQRDRANYDAWLQAHYFYDALCAVSPVLHAFARNGTKPTPYLDKPYELVTQERKEEKPKEEVQAKVGAAKFLAFAERLNQKFPNDEHQRAPNEIKE
jgi:hypothetical protein